MAVAGIGGGLGDEAAGGEAGSMTGERKAGTSVRGRRGTRTGAVLGASAVLIALGAAPASAADPPDSPSDLPTYKTAGSAVKGAVSSANAPALQPGTYTDTIGRGEKKFYAVDLDGTSSAYLSAFGLPRPGSAVKYGDGLTVLLESTDGTDCQSASSPTFHDDGAARPVGDYTSRVIDPDGQCQEAGPYLLSVERKSDPASDPGAWPLEIKYMLEPGLRPGASPAPVDPGSSATPAPATGAAKPARGGTGFNDAPAVGPGVWRDRLLPGQTRFYRVPVDWGQQLFATAEFANAEKVTDDTGYSGDGLRIELFNTARGAVTYKSGSYDGEQAAVGLLTPAAAYANRVDAGADYVRRAMRFSGWYYVAVSLHAETQDFIDGGVPFTLRLKTLGEAQPGPAYRGDAAKAGFGITSDDRDAASEGVVPSGGSADGRKLLAFTAFGVGGALLAGLAAWTLVARRRPAGTAHADGDPRGR